MITLTLLALLALQPPAPSLGERKSSQPQSDTATAREQTAPDPRGTNQPPLLVQVQPAPKTDADTAKERQQEQDKASEQRWARGLALLTGFVALIQAGLIGGQIYVARQQNTIIGRQTEIMRLQERAASSSALAAKEQTEHMLAGLEETRASNREAGKSAEAMERIAAALTAQGERLEASIAMQREMIRDNRQVAILQNRARLQLIEWKVFRIMDEHPHQADSFPPNHCAVRFFIKNTGAGAAVIGNVRVNVPSMKVSRTANLEVILEHGQVVMRTPDFIMPRADEREMEILTQPFTVNVEVDYADEFANRTARFSFTTWDHADALTTGDKSSDAQEWLVHGGLAMNNEVEHENRTDGQPEDQP